MEITKEDMQRALQKIETVLSEIEYLAIRLPILKTIAKQILELDSITEGIELVQAYTDLIDEIENNLKIIQL